MIKLKIFTENSVLVAQKKRPPALQEAGGRNNNFGKLVKVSD